jgi:DoxX-like family
MQSATQTNLQSSARIWTGRILSALCVLFMVFDGVTKLIKERHVLQASAQLGYPVHLIPVVGTILLICTAFYVIPPTSVFGAVLLTGYLGGAVASSLRAGNPLFETVFPILFAILMWAGIYLREGRLHALLPVRR